jgi:hypothetical protein
MKASELRIGNYVNVPIQEQCPFRIDAFEYCSEKFIKVAQEVNLNGFEAHPLTWYGGDLQPIPLTEEWHNNFGININGHLSFEYVLPRKNNMDIRVIFQGDYVFLRQSKNSNFPMADDVVVIWNKDLTKRDMFVHEWQNLYFALTGEELTFKQQEQ